MTVLRGKAARKRIGNMVDRWEKDLLILKSTFGEWDGDQYDDVSEVFRNLETAIAQAYHALARTDESLAERRHLPFTSKGPRSCLDGVPFCAGSGGMTGCGTVTAEAEQSNPRNVVIAECPKDTDNDG